MASVLGALTGTRRLAVVCFLFIVAVVAVVVAVWLVAREAHRLDWDGQPS